MRTLALALIFAGGLAAPCVVRGAPAGGVSSMDAAALSKIEALGHQLWLVDQAAWRATDALQQQGGLAGFPEDARPRGWVTTPLDLGGLHWSVAFVAADKDEATMVWADVDVRFGETLETDVRRLEIPRELSSVEQAQLKAIDVAHGGGLRTCGDKVNTAVVLARDESDRPQFKVYFLSASDDEGIAAGGHTRVSVDGETLEAIERFEQTRSCLKIPHPSDRKREPTALTLSHLTSPEPTEIHVFLSKTFQRPIYVLTVENRRLWEVDDGRIRLVEDEPPADATEQPEQ